MRIAEGVKHEILWTEMEIPNEGSVAFAIRVAVAAAVGVGIGVMVVVDSRVAVVVAVAVKMIGPDSWIFITRFNWSHLPVKKLINVTEVSDQGLDALLGERVTFFCANYIYYGTLTGVNTTDIILEDAYIVYETGAFDASTFKDAQRLGKEWRIRTASIESYGLLTAKTK